MLTVSTSRLRSLRDTAFISLQTRLLWWVVGSYLVARLFSAAIMIWMAPHSDPLVVSYRDGDGDGPLGYWDIVHSWDGKWYEEIIRDGYPNYLPARADGTVDQNVWAFLPLFPAMTAGLQAITGLSFGAAGSLISLAAGGGAVAMMAVLLRDRIGAPSAFAATLLFSTAPPSPVLQMTYTESLGLLLLCVFLWALTEHRWMIASAVAVLLGFERPIALSLVGVVLAVLLRMVVRRDTLHTSRRDAIGAVLTLMVTGLSGLLWPAVAALRTGLWDAYTQTQSAWRGPGEVQPFRPWFTNFGLLFGDRGIVILVLMVVGGLAIMLGPWSRRLGFVLRAWMLSYTVYLLAVIDVWTSTYRYLLFLWPIAAVLIGAANPDARKRVLIGWRTAAWVVVFLGWQVWWIWELLRFIPPADNAI